MDKMGLGNLVFLKYEIQKRYRVQNRESVKNHG